MKRLLGLCLGVAAILAASGAQARSGGPDRFGYTWRDTSDGVTYSWEDISAVGTDIMVDGDDVNYGFRTLSFPFPYYGATYTQVAACSNGWLSLVDGVNDDYANTMLPDFTTPNGVIAAFWDDLRGTTGISRVLFADRGTYAVITWENIHDLGDNTAVNTFQVILYADGRILAQYQNLTGDRTSCTAGIESPDDTDGLTAWYDDPAGITASNYAIEYDPPVPVAANLNCTGAIPLNCGSRVSGDNRAQGAANQPAYLCSRGDYAGREIVYQLQFATPTDVRLVLDSQSGDQDLIVLNGCDPNSCVQPPADVANLTGVTGPLYVVVDSSVANEGAFELRADCMPLASQLDCANARAIFCGDTVAGDLAAGSARQDAYGCSLGDYAGNEQVYRIDLSAPTNVEFVLNTLSGNPDLFVLTTTCDPNGCLTTDNGSLTANGISGSVYVVVDCAPGEEGQYQLSVNCLSNDMTFCGTGLLEMDPWGLANGVWLVNGWLYHPFDTHDFALRIDGGTTYSTGGSCPDFPVHQFGVRVPNGPAFAEYSAPEGSVRTELSEVNTGTCCGLGVRMTVTNTDTVPHFYEYRVYHDTAFGEGDGGNCFVGSPVDGGPIEVNGTRYDTEQDLVALGSQGCPGQVEMFSADHPTELRSSFEMLPPNLPTNMEFLHWNDGGNPCTQWTGFVDGYDLSGCSDTSLLFVWRFPQSGVLNPGESSTASYRIGNRCAWSCAACESPTMASASAVDAGPCQGGIKVTWDPAFFPGSGNGTYHVYRSLTDATDALSRPPLTGALGVSGTQWVDTTTTAGPTYIYVVVAESLDYPGCGTGPVVDGSTAQAAAAPVQDLADVDPPSTIVGPALRAYAHTDTTVSFRWPTAPAPASDEHYVVLRSDDDPQGPFLIVGRPTAQDWTDPDAPPRFTPPAHVWFYDVRIADACENMSLD